MKYYTLLFSMLLLSPQLRAQELWGASNSNYAGTMGHDLNPASIVANPFRWELHFVSADVSIMNNYMYLRRNSNAIRSGMRGESVSEDRFTDKYNTRDKSAYGAAYIKLPSFMYSTPKWGLGFHVSTRTALSARGVPYHLAKFMKEGFSYTPQHQIDYVGGNASVTGMNWHEAGITGGMTLQNSSESFITGGITLNYLYGLNSFFMLIDNIHYNVQSDSLWEIYIANVEYGHALSDDADNVPKKKGSGFSGSLGMQYYRNRNDAAYNPCSKDRSLKKYDYKIGVSIIDIGKIKYNSQTLKFKFTDVATDWYGIDTIKVNGVGNSDTTFNNQFFGTPMGAINGNSFDMWMPAALAVQFDYSYTPNIYFNFSAIQRLPIGPYAIKRANQFSVSARYETKRFEIAIPYSYFDYFRHRLGLSVRYGILTVGTDMLGPYTGLFDAYGLDFYIGIKWQHFPDCDRKKSKVKRGGKNDCFTDF